MPLLTPKCDVVVAAYQIVAELLLLLKQSKLLPRALPGEVTMRMSDITLDGQAIPVEQLHNLDISQPLGSNLAFSIK
jgi:hypothetical protein